MDLFLMGVELSDPVSRQRPQIASKPWYYGALFLFYSFFNLIRSTFNSAWMVIQENEIDSVIVYSKPQLILNVFACFMALVAIICTVIRLTERHTLAITLTIAFSVFIQVICTFSSLITFHHLSKNGTIFMTQGYLASALSILFGLFSLLLFSIDIFLLRNSKKSFNASQRRLIFAFFLALLIIIFGGFLFSYLEEWTFEKSIQFVIVTLLTIGYGDLSASQNISKIAVICYSIIGLLFVGFFVISIGDVIVEKCQYSFIESKSSTSSLISLKTFNRPIFNHSRLSSRNTSNLEEVQPLHQPLESRLILTIILWILGYWVGSSLIFSYLEEWSFIDGLYFTFETMTTIGYGDLKLLNPISWEFWYFFIFNAVSILAFVFEGFGHDVGYRLNGIFKEFYIGGALVGDREIKS